MLWLAKIKKRLPFNRRRRRVNKALRRRKLEKYMPVILFLLGLLVIMIAIVALLVVKIGMPFYETITEPHAARDWVLSFGSWSYLVLFAITYLQVVIAILPGEPSASARAPRWICASTAKRASSASFLSRFSFPARRRIFLRTPSG